MKVLHIGKYYPPYPGGIESYCKVICEGLFSRNIGVDIVVSNDMNKFTHTNINGIDVFRLPRLKSLRSIPICPAMPFFVKKLLKTNHYDIVHIHFPNPMGEISFLFSGFKGKKIITYHADHGFNNRLKTLYLPVVNNMLRKCSNIIFSSENYLNNRTLLDKYRNKCRIVPIPLNPYFLSQIDYKKVSQIKEKYGNFILFVGNLNSYKGQEYLIKAMKNINSNLIMIGSGANNSNIKKLINKMHLENKIFIIDRVGNDELKSFLDACEVLCLPSVSQAETFGIVLLEAMARSKPVISTELGTGTSWVNKDGKTGFVVSPGSVGELSDAISKILGNEKLKEQMGNNAKKRVLDYFTVDKTIDSLVSLYKN